MKRRNSLTNDQLPKLISAYPADPKNIQSYQDHPENLNSSDSDSDYSDALTAKREELRRKNTYFGIEIKKQFGLMQFASIFFVAGSMMMIGVYMNAQLAYMLPDKDYFNIPRSDIGMQTSNLTIYSLPFSLITTFFISYAFELLGRKLTISLSYATTALCYLILPRTKPHFWLLAAVRCAIGVTMAGPISHPLINDYVRKNSRGKAIALNGLGQVFGEVMAMGVLLNLSKEMKYEEAFAMTASIIFVFAVFFFIFIKNPNLNSIAKRIDRRHGAQRASSSMKESP